jgi:CRP-like cAMP-binding protein
VTNHAAVGAPPPKTHLNHKLPPPLPPFAAAVAALLDLNSVTRPVGPGQEIVSEGRRCSATFLITEGIAIRYRILRDGQRQILNFVLPGDFIGVRSCFFESALYSTKTLTDTAIAVVPLARLIDLFDRHPGLAPKMLRLFAREAAAGAERLIMLGRRPARDRIAHFLLELLVRLQAVGLADERSYRLPLTQEIIGDALGLSIPYVNRVLHQLRDDGLVRIKDHVVIIDDLDELSALADFEDSYLRPLSIADMIELG